MMNIPGKNSRRFIQLLVSWCIAKQFGLMDLFCNLNNRTGFLKASYFFCSSVLGSDKAIDVNIAIMRAFVKLKEILLTHKDWAEKLEDLEKKYQLYEADIQVIFEAIRKLLESAPMPEKPPIGFHVK